MPPGLSLREPFGRFVGQEAYVQLEYRSSNPVRTVTIYERAPANRRSGTPCEFLTQLPRVPSDSCVTTITPAGREAHFLASEEGVSAVALYNSTSVTIHSEGLTTEDLAAMIDSLQPVDPREVEGLTLAGADEGPSLGMPRNIY